MINPQIPDNLLEGLIDLHIHTAPDVRPRLQDDLQAADAAKAAGMAAIMIKSHHTLTADRAAIAEKTIGGLRVFGGLALNMSVGGLNPQAVEFALRMGARQIWMPTVSAAYFRSQKGEPGGITIFDQAGELDARVCAIIDLLREYDAVLGSGHLSPQETLELARYARRQGLRKVLVTHPEASFVNMPLQMQVELAGEGVLFERCYVNTTQWMNYTTSIPEIAAAIRQVGIQSTVIATDFGQTENLPPIDGLRAYAAGLLGEGFSLEQVRRMAATNPAMLLAM